MNPDVVPRREITSNVRFAPESGHSLRDELTPRRGACATASVRPTDCIELIDQSAYMELGRVNRYAKALRLLPR